jgi:hypothetical protein
MSNTPLPVPVKAPAFKTPTQIENPQIDSLFNYQQYFEKSISHTAYLRLNPLDTSELLQGGMYHYDIRNKTSWETETTVF